MCGPDWTKSLPDVGAFLLPICQDAYYIKVGSFRVLLTMRAIVWRDPFFLPAAVAR